MTMTSPCISEEVLFFDEPGLQFAHGQHAIDPHDGLTLFGPFSHGQPSHPHSPTYIVIGAPEGIRAVRDWSVAMNGPAAVADVRKQRLWAPFPGFEIAFGSPWSPEPAAVHELDRAKLLDASRKRDNHERCYAVVEQFMEAFEKARKRDEKIAVALCVVPDEVRQNCRTESRVSDATDEGIGRKTKESRKQGQLDLYESYDPEQYKLSPDFRRQIKARAMRFDVPLQIIQESTLRLSDDAEFGQRRLTRLSDRMWNLGTALYYKSGGKPWKLDGARDGVCYIGIAFRRVEGGKKTACCAAQMFLDSGDGIVFLGEYGPWYSPEREQFHLSRPAAKRLLEGILKTYAEQDGRPLKEVFLHCRSSIGKDEFAGYLEACPAGCKLVGVRVRSDGAGPRLFRTGSMPVVRGTFLKSSDRGGLLYASGFKPRRGTYDGWETPIPLRLDVQHGEASIETVAQDILALTKLN